MSEKRQKPAENSKIERDIERKSEKVPKMAGNFGKLSSGGQPFGGKAHQT